MVDYQISFWIAMGFAIIEALALIILFIKKRKSKKVVELLKEVRKGMREHHKAEAGLFRAVDNVLVSLSLKSLQSSKNKEGEWNEYG